MRKGKHAHGKNVFNQLQREINKKSNPVFNKKSQVNDYDKQKQEEKAKGKKYKSTIDTSNGVDEYFALANLTNKKYEVVDEQTALQTVNTVNIIPINQSSNILLMNTLKNSTLNTEQKIEFLSIPKKPRWKEGIKKEQFETMEREAFLAWRKALSEEELKNINLTITPFEKNIEVWKQLWLVVEKCNLLFQIVDGRNPLYYRCPDLDKYLKDLDVNKESVLMINKADLMSREIRSNWADYFIENKIRFIFFSALEELEKISEINHMEEEAMHDEGSNNLKKKDKGDDMTRIYSRDELIIFIREEAKRIPSKDETKYIGFIGYPNVGKSSIINVLMKQKKVGVAMMPGKTKHYQTLFLPSDIPNPNTNAIDKSICLMDCPGLVFPSFNSSRADMMVNGIFPIDTIKDYHSPISIIIQRIPTKIFNDFYKINLPDLYSAKQFLQIIAEKRGFYTGSSLPDEAKTAKLVLKDYVSGKLLYCYLRPDYTEERFGFIAPYDQPNKTVDLTEEEKQKLKLIESIPATFDDNYEKIIEDNEVLDNNKVQGANFDDVFFNQEHAKENRDMERQGEALSSKQKKKELKLALKRGQITEDEYDNVQTIGDYEGIMKRINPSETGKMNRDMIKTKVINF